MYSVTANELLQHNQVEAMIELHVYGHAFLARRNVCSASGLGPKASFQSIIYRSCKRRVMILTLLAVGTRAYYRAKAILMQDSIAKSSVER